jgi:ribose-phosphate pyrophosphokinase
MTDDIIDTAGTITNGAQELIDKGAKRVLACCTHPLLSGPAIERIKNSPIDELLTTNTIPLSKEKLIDKITVLSVAPLLGEALIRIHEDLSVSKLFD